MMTIKDRSEYFRGLLILSRLDQEVSITEKDQLIKISTILGFEPTFGRKAIEDIGINKYISVIPPKFSNKKIVISFMDDGLRLAFLDLNFHSMELKWLGNTAKINRIEKKYWLQIVEKFKKNDRSELINSDFAINSYVN